MNLSPAQVTVLIVALIHTGIALIEMLFWRRPPVHARLGFTQPEADKVAPIVANAGLYNLFIAGGLAWGAFAQSAAAEIQTYFLACVTIAGIFGAATLKWTTLVLQTLPGIVALAVIWVNKAG